MPGFCLSTASRQGLSRARGSRASAASWLAYAILLGLGPAATPTAAELSVAIYTGTKGTVKKLTREQSGHLLRAPDQMAGWDVGTVFVGTLQP